METETENNVENQVEETKIDDPNKPLGDIIKKKKDKKKAKKEKLLAELDRKRKFEDFSREANSESAEKKIKFDNVFDAQKAVGRKGRDFTVSLALAGSILDNAQSAELRTYLGKKYLSYPDIIWKWQYNTYYKTLDRIGSIDLFETILFLKVFN